MSEIPSGLLYTKDHEWIRVEDNKGIIGITDYAQNSLGDIVYVELPSVNDEVDAGDEFGTIESVKAVSPLFMPISGTVTEVNADLADQPEMVNDDCYSDGWLVRVEIANPEDTENLLSPEDYETFLIEEAE